MWILLAHLVVKEKIRDGGAQLTLIRQVIRCRHLETIQVNPGTLPKIRIVAYQSTQNVLVILRRAGSLVGGRFAFQTQIRPDGTAPLAAFARSRALGVAC